MKKAAKKTTKHTAKKAASPKKKAASKAKANAKAKPKPKAKAKPAAKAKPKAKAKVVKKTKVKARPVAKKAPAKKAAPKAKAQAKVKAPVAKAKSPAARPMPEVKSRTKRPASKAERKPEVPKEPRNFIPVLPDPIIPKRREEPRRIMQKPLAEQDNRSRYSDMELEEFREIINQKLVEARKELTTLQAAITNANEHGTDDTANTFKMLEDGSDSLAKEEAGQLAGRQKKFIEQLENALIRIENKTYGICRVTGLLIPKERLRAVPHTTQSIEAKMNQYRD
jgi:RNA polymerase-binding transcription factor DksA